MLLDRHLVFREGVMLPNIGRERIVADHHSQAQMDHGLISPISISPESRIPDPTSGSSTKKEYDLYFRIRRDNSGLVAWSKTCLDVQRRLLEDLQQTSLTAEDRCEILRGILVVQSLTLEKWITAGDEASTAGQIAEDAHESN